MTTTKDRAPADAATPRSAEQRRAAHALQMIKALEDNVDLRKKYRAYTERLGPAILVNGLGQALATERAAGPAVPSNRASPRSAVGSVRPKADELAHRRLFENLEAWLCGGGGVYPTGDLLAAIVGGSETLYLRAQTEALAWLVWHKKFCRAYLPASDHEEG